MLSHGLQEKLFRILSGSLRTLQSRIIHYHSITEPVFEFECCCVSVKREIQIK